MARHSSPRLHCSIFIGSSVTPTTVDVSSSVAILTRESSRMAALKYLRGSGFFDAIQEDLYVSREQAKEVRRLPPDDYRLDTTADLRRIIEELELVSVDDDTLTATLHAIAYPVTPYDGGRERKR